MRMVEQAPSSQRGAPLDNLQLYLVRSRDGDRAGHLWRPHLRAVNTPGPKLSLQIAPLRLLPFPTHFGEVLTPVFCRRTRIPSHHSTIRVFRGTRWIRDPNTNRLCPLIYTCARRRWPSVHARAARLLRAAAFALRSMQAPLRYFRLQGVHTADRPAARTVIGPSLLTAVPCYPLCLPSRRAQVVRAQPHRSLQAAPVPWLPRDFQASTSSCWPRPRGWTETTSLKATATIALTRVPLAPTTQTALKSPSRSSRRLRCDRHVLRSVFAAMRGYLRLRS